MVETIWNFGYRCEILRGMCSWVGIVFAPRWHPVRVAGLDDLLVFMIKGEWNVFTGSKNALSHYEELNEVYGVASKLYVMQDEWDTLSPYEREYLIW